MAESRRPIPRNLRAGGLVLAILIFVAAAAPWLATDRPWVAQGPGGVVFPVWSDRAAHDTALKPVVSAPIPYHPNRLDLSHALEAPSRSHLLGTDGLGRDVAARIVHGARVSVSVGLLAAFLALVVGVPLGALTGYRGGWWDVAATRITEAVLCFPTLLLVLAILASAPPWLRELPEVARVAIVLGATGWIPVARYIRGEFLRLRGSDVAAAARAAGAGHVRIIVRHLLPAALAPVLVTAAFTVAGAVALEAALSFLGFGVHPPTSSWGGLLNDARTHVARAWWLVAFPGLALFLALLACNLVGEGIRDVLDPRRR